MSTAQGKFLFLSSSHHPCKESQEFCLSSISCGSFEKDAEIELGRYCHLWLHIFSFYQCWKQLCCFIIDTIFKDWWI